MSNARDFSISLSREWQAARDDIVEAVAGIALEATTRIVRRSPVDTGRFRGNWSVSVGVESSEVKEMTDKTGGETIVAASNLLSGYPDTLPPIYIQNNLPYANRLENGWSKQAPNGMVALTVAELNAAMDGT